LVINGVTYYASEDSHVRWGTLANTNYGTSTVLQVTDSYQDASSTFSGGMETDILESLGIWGTETTQHTLHWDGYTTSHQSATSGELSYAPTADGYHTHGLYWEAGVMEFYIDGVQSWTWVNSRVCNLPCYILLSLQLGGWGNNNPGPQVDNQTMQVDYVRVWSGTKN
jgi:beta-glucanase (GH16 family)